MSEEAWLDLSVIRCPSCGRYYADASWYVVEMGSDIECGKCHSTFNTKEYATDRMLLRLEIDETGKVRKAGVAKHLWKKEKRK